jgi:hypothetical protein
VNDQGQLLIGNSTSLVGPFAYSRGLQLTNQGAQFNAFTSNQFGEGIAFVKTRGTPSSPHTIVQNGDALGSVSFSGSDGSGYVLGCQIVSFVDQIPGANDMPTCLTFATTPDGSTNCTERMRITSAGNVGIGTGTPTEKLDVTGNIKASQLYINNPSGDSSIEVGGAGNVYIDLKKPNSDDRDLRITTDGTDSIIDSNGGLFISTANNERMRITSTGNVGIGTSTPSSKLHLTSSGPSWPSGLTLENTAASRKFALSTRSDLSIPARFSISDETALAERVSILGSNGNLGIGELNPSSKLHVAGDLTMSSATVATSATAGTNGDVPAQVAGYLVVNINGTARKIPYYA